MQGLREQGVERTVLRLLTAPKPKVPVKAGVGRDAYMAVLN